MDKKWYWYRIRLKIRMAFWNSLVWIMGGLELKARRIHQRICRAARLKRYDPQAYKGVCNTGVAIGFLLGLNIAFMVWGYFVTKGL